VTSSSGRDLSGSNFVPPRLSLCMPTFNRASFIGETLDCLLAQATADVEIVIVDGGSTDNTPEVVAPYLARSDRLRYVRQAENRGIDRDMDRSVNEARGDYVWLVSSDDLLLAGAVDRVLSEVEREPDLLIVNAEIRSLDMKVRLRERVLPITRDVDYSSADRERFFVDMASYLSFMGCVVIRRPLWQARVQERFYGTEFTSLGVVLWEGVPPKTRVIAQPLVLIRYGNFTWAARMFEISIFKWPDLIWSLPYPEALKRRIAPLGGWRELPRLLYHRALGGFAPPDAKGYLEQRRVGGLLRPVVRAIARLPCRLLNLLAILYYSSRPQGGDTVYLLHTCGAYWRGAPRRR
jgi:glycosyltransferase involved in cell wall biosynthesis